jgi:hypothetical protein
MPAIKSGTLYHHRTSGGAEYLTDRYVICPDGSKEGTFTGATIIVRIDGDIREYRLNLPQKVSHDRPR